jgi:uncharacterized protein
MLQRPDVLPFVREVQRGGGPVLEVDFLLDPGDGRVLALLDWLLRLVRRLEGAPLRTVQEALRRQERRVRDARRLSGIARTLLGMSRFEPPAGAQRAAEFREVLFDARGRHWPPLPGDEDVPYREAADALRLSPGLRRDLRQLTRADHPGERLLVRSPRVDAQTLLDRYNLDLARGVLLDASTVTVRARGGWKDLARAAKLARLMYRLLPEEGPAQGRRRAYRLELTGPAAPFLAHPRRYGARFASIVPALIRAPSWSMEARVERNGRSMPYRLEAGAPVGRGRRARYDSRWEADMAKGLRTALAESGTGAEGGVGGRIGRSAWTLYREDVLLPVGDELVLPDFTLRHRDGREAIVELVGFWTPEYLAEKLRKLKAAKLPNLVLVVSEALAAAGGEEAIRDSGARVVWFRGKVRAGEVLKAAEAVAV